MFTAEIKTDNAAFGDSPGIELARILRKLADDVELRDLRDLDNVFVALFDVNGNRVGHWDYTIPVAPHPDDSCTFDADGHCTNENCAERGR